ncbi:hypothetical protein DFJ74DRAFT_705857 [Hyaloraphidium curvatum]|nr:hypothetical protein DFJ74DRAFT_705857 [Hyaloraphidium curvatum]
MPPNPTDPTQQAHAVNSVLVPLLLFAVGGTLIVLAFCYLRTRIPFIYQSRRRIQNEPPARLSSAFLGFVTELIRIPEEMVMRSSGTDSLIILRFLRSSFALFCVLSVLGLTILTPVNSFGEEVERNPANNTLKSPLGFDEVTLLRKISFENVSPGSPGIDVHIVALFVIELLVFMNLRWFYRECVNTSTQRIRHDLRDSSAKDGEAPSEAVRQARIRNIDLRTVMLVNLPDSMRDELIIRRFFADAGLDNIEQVVVPVSDDEAETANLIEFLPTGRPMIRTGFLGLFGPRVDAISYHFDRFKTYDAKVQAIRSQELDDSKPTPYAFVTFKDAQSAAIACQCVVPLEPATSSGWRIVRAPHPRDINWMNISSWTSESQIMFWRTVLTIVTLVALVFFWSQPIAVISNLLRPESLQAILPPAWSEWVAGWSDATKIAVAGAAPALLVAVYMALLPPIMILLCYLQGIEAYSWIDISCLNKFYFYSIINIVLVYTLSSGVTSSLSDILGQPKEIPTILAKNLTSIAPFFVNWINLNTFIQTPILLLLPPHIVPQLFIYVVRKFRHCTPRLVAEFTLPPHLTNLNLGLLLVAPLMVNVIALIFSGIQPLVLPVAALYFLVAFAVLKYQLLYMNFVPYDTRGLGLGDAGFIGMIVKRVLAGELLHVLLMVGALTLKGAADKAVPAGMTLLALLIVSWKWVAQFFKGGAGDGFLTSGANKPYHLSEPLSSEEAESRPEVLPDPISSSMYRYGVNVDLDHDGEIDMDDENDPLTIYRADHFTNYAEPIVSRIDGILNPREDPLKRSADPVRFMEDDPIAGSYLHPARVGRLPGIWLPGFSRTFEFTEFDDDPRAGLAKLRAAGTSDNLSAEEAEAQHELMARRAQEVADKAASKGYLGRVLTTMDEVMDSFALWASWLLR